MSIYSKQPTDSCTLYQNCNGIFHIDSKNSKIHMKPQRPWIVKAILSQKEAESIIASDFKICYEARIIKMVMILEWKQSYRPVEK
jgi:hypothetical protein